MLKHLIFQIRGMMGSELTDMENPKNPHCVLVINHKPSPVLLFSPHIAAMETALHYATFDIRIAGNVQQPCLIQVQRVVV